MNTITGGSATELAPATVRATGDTRVNLSLPHLISASIHAKQLQSIEQQYSGQPFGEFWNEVFANASSAIFASVSALESYVNELFVDYKTLFPGLRVEVLEKLWELHERKPILAKYELALLLKESAPMDRGATPYSDVATVIELRNSLIHFRPEWFSEQDTHAKISARLKYKAHLSPFFSATEPFFPRGWASYATVNWAIQNVINFILELEKLGQFPARLPKHMSRLEFLSQKS